MAVAAALERDSFKRDFKKLNSTIYYSGLETGYKK